MEKVHIPETPPIETPEVKKPARGSRRKLAAALFLGLLAITGAFVFHLMTRTPVTLALRIPVLAEVSTKVPKFQKNVGVLPEKAEGLNLDGFGKSIVASVPLMAPRGLSLSLDGSRLFVVDTDVGVVSVFDASGKALFSLAGEGQGKLQLPVSAASSPDGKVFVVDRIQNRVATYSPNGEFTGNFWPQNMPPTFKMAPLSVVFDRAGNMYLGDAEGAAYVFDKAGSLKLRLSPPEGNLQGPYGIAVNDSGAIAVTDANRGRVLTFKPNGELDRVLKGFGLPRGVAVDSDGKIFVVDTLSHEVVMHSAEGKKLHTFGEWGALDGQLDYPDSVAVDGDGRLFVSDRGNRRIQIWTY